MVCAGDAPKPIGARFGDVKIGHDVKRAFVTASNKTEYMWVHVTRTDNPDYVEGHLQSHPYFTDYDPPLEHDAHVVVPYDQISDIKQCKAAS
jgi:hypothetical protein